ncbi:MAG: hypothetical protein HYU97_04155 [Deltaproteobacteria bacterium]|nr:hypothetical protein [Deltaproteobacteria bacterium]
MFISAISYLAGLEEAFQAVKAYCKNTPSAGLCSEDVRRSNNLPEFLVNTSSGLVKDFFSKASALRTKLIEQSLRAQIAKGDPKINLPDLNIDFGKCDGTAALNQYLRNISSPYRVVLSFNGKKLQGVMGMAESEGTKKVGAQTVEEFVFGTNPQFFALEGDPIGHLAFNNSLDSVAYFPEHIRTILEDRRSWNASSIGLVRSNVAPWLKQKHFEALQDCFAMYGAADKNKRIPDTMVNEALELVKVHEEGHFLIDQRCSPLYRTYLSMFENGKIFFTYIETITDTYIMDTIADAYEEDPAKGKRLNLLWIACRRSAENRNSPNFFGSLAAELVLRDLLGVYEATPEDLRNLGASSKPAFLRSLAEHFRHDFEAQLRQAALSVVITLATHINEFSHLPSEPNTLPRDEESRSQLIQDTLDILKTLAAEKHTCGNAHFQLRVAIALFGAVAQKVGPQWKLSVEALLESWGEGLVARLQ